MNFESIKRGFQTYLEEKQKSSAEISSEKESASIWSNGINTNSDVSIFMHSSEFKNYLVEEVGADSSIFSKTINEILEMDVVNGKLVSPDENPDGDSYEQSDSGEANKLYSLEGDSETDALIPPGEDDAQNLTKNILNDAFSDENVINALDTDKTGSLNEEEINSFLSNLEEQYGDLTFDNISEGLQNLVNPQNNEDSQNPINDLINKIFENKTVQKALDLDGDGELSDEEKEAFLKFAQGDAEELTEQALKDAFDKIISGEVTSDKIKEANSAKPENKVDEAKETPSSSGSNGASGSSGASGSGGVSGGGSGGGVGSSGGASSSGSSVTNTETSKYAGMSLDELEKEKKSQQSNLSDAYKDKEAVYSGSDSDVKKAKDDETKAKDDYKDAIEKDEKIEKQDKEDLKKALDDIDEKQKAVDDANKDINDTQSQISDMESTISDDESTISSLETTVSALESQLASADDEAKSSIQSNLAAAKKELEQAKQTKENHEKELNKLKDTLSTQEKTIETAETELKSAEDSKKTIEDKISSTMSDSTKEAKKSYDDAVKDLKETKETKLKEADKSITDTKSELDKIDEAITAKKTSEKKKEYGVSSFDLDCNLNLSDSQKGELEQIKKIFEQNKDKYEKVAQATGVPAELIAAIHYREGSCDFTTYLHNGEKLGKPTTLVPQGICFSDWTDAAIDAINREKSNYQNFAKRQGHNVDMTFSTAQACCDYAEGYNGTGYYDRGIASPYVWAGTDKYKGGMFVADRQFSSSAVDKRVGVAVIMKALMEM